MRAIGIVLQTEVFQVAAKIELPPRTRGGGFGPGYYRRAARNSVASRLNRDDVALPIRVEPVAVVSGESFWPRCVALNQIGKMPIPSHQTTPSSMRIRR
jgi:hypothetical protein